MNQRREAAGRGGDRRPVRVRGAEGGGSALPFDDLRALRSELTDPRFETDYWKEQIKLQIKLMKKAEQQAFAGGFGLRDHGVSSPIGWRRGG